MQKWLWLFVPVLFFALIAAAPAQETTPEQKIPVIQMARGTVDVDPVLTLAVQKALGQGYGLLPNTNAYYAITNVSEYQSGVFLVSVAGLDFTRKPDYHITDPTISEQMANLAQLQHANEWQYAGPEHWNFMDHGVWTGLVMVTTYQGRTIGALKGTYEFSSLLDVFDLPAELDTARFDPRLPLADGDGFFDGEIPVAPHILPWQSEKSAYYGVLGIHPNGFNGVVGGDTWVAVDFVGGPFLGDDGFPNMVYAANDGIIDYVCTDGLQRAFKAGWNFYTHFTMEDSGNITIQEGESFEQGTPLGALYKGSRNCGGEAICCGYTDQAAENYHLHFGMPDYGSWPFETYTLSFADGCFYSYDDEPICPTGTLTSKWDVPNPPGDPPPIGGSGSDGASFWDFVVEGFYSMILALLPLLGDHQSLDLATNVLLYASVPLELVFWMTLTYVNMTFVLITFFVIIAGELVRLLVAGWFFIKKIIPGLST